MFSFCSSILEGYAAFNNDLRENVLFSVLLLSGRVLCGHLLILCFLPWVRVSGVICSHISRLARYLYGGWEGVPCPPHLSWRHAVHNSHLLCLYSYFPCRLCFYLFDKGLDKYNLLTRANLNKCQRRFLVSNLHSFILSGTFTSFEFNLVWF